MFLPPAPFPTPKSWAASENIITDISSLHHASLEHQSKIEKPFSSWGSVNNYVDMILSFFEHLLKSIRRLLGSTDQANPSCFYFRILWILMEWHGMTWILIFWFPQVSAGPQKQDHKVEHNYLSLEKFSGLFWPLAHVSGPISNKLVVVVFVLTLSFLLYIPYIEVHSYVLKCMVRIIG